MHTSRTAFPLVLAALAAAAAAASAAFGQPLDGLALLLAVGPVALDPAALTAAVEKLGAKAAESLDGLKDQQASLAIRLQGVEQKLADSEGLPVQAAGGVQTRSARAAAIVKAISEGSGLNALRSNSTKRFEAAVPGLQVRAAITGATASPTAQRDPEFYGALRPRSTLLDLLPRLTTGLAAIEYLRSTVTGSAAVQVNEGDAKSELSMAFELATARVVTVAAWTPASRQILDDLAGLQDFVSTTLLDALDAATEAQILSGSGAPGNLSGLLLEATAYSRAQPGDLPVDTLRRAVTQVHLAGGEPSGLVLHPVDLEALELQRDDEGRFLLELDAPAADGTTRVWRVPTVTHTGVDAGDFLMADFGRAVRLYDREQAGVRISADHADFFTRNLVAILAELRVALAVPRPELLVTGALTPA